MSIYKENTVNKMPDPITSLLITALIAGLGTVIFWPERGLLARWQQTRHVTERMRREDALKHIHKWEMDGRRPTTESIAGTLHISLNETADLLTHMQANKLVQIKDGDIHLTGDGREIALHIIRAHRLWERHLAEETGFSEMPNGMNAPNAPSIASPPPKPMPSTANSAIPPMIRMATPSPPPTASSSSTKASPSPLCP